MKNTSKNGSSPSTSIPAGSAEANREPNIKFALKVAVSLGAGMVFGFAAEKGRGEQPVNDTTDPANAFACNFCIQQEPTNCAQINFLVASYKAKAVLCWLHYNHSCM